MKGSPVSAFHLKQSALRFFGCVVLLVAALSFPLIPAASAEAVVQAPATRPAGNITVEDNAQLFATLCALHAAGFESEVSAAGFHPVRARLRDVLMSQQGPATEVLRAFYKQHLLGDPAATLSRYISFALVAGPPPTFSYTLRHEELPPDVLSIEDFNEILANFYREAQIDRLWAQVQPEYEREVARLNAPVAQLVMTSSGYLRELLKSSSPRTFAVYVEPLVGAKTNFRNYGDHYAIVLSPGAELPLDEIRHAFLHLLLDPLTGRYRRAVAGKKSLLEIAARAPRLPVEYKDDFSAFFTECLVRAVELRLRRLSPEKLAAAIHEAEGDGFVLVRPLVRELAKFEQTEPAMSFYFPDLLRGIDVAEETKRLQAVSFTVAAAAPEAPLSAGAASSGKSDLENWLAEGERQIAAQNAEAAATAFQRVLAKEPEQPRALYGLAVAAILQGEAQRAKDLFHRLVVGASAAAGSTAGKDPLIQAWSHVYLGRIYDVDGNRELALSEYRAALAIEGAPEAARQAARRGIERGYVPGESRPRRPGE